MPAAASSKRLPHQDGAVAEGDLPRQRRQRTPEETILKAYDTMTGVEKAGFRKSRRWEERGEQQQQQQQQRAISPASPGNGRRRRGTPGRVDVGGSGGKNALQAPMGR